MRSGRFDWSEPDVAKWLDKVDELMLAQVGASPLGSTAAEMIKAGGKRLRPALTLNAEALKNGPLPAEAIGAAAAVELVHLASLVHDDLLDKAERRRGLPLSEIQASEALLLGDYLLATAFSLAAKAGAGTVEVLADAVAEMAAGEDARLGGRAIIKPLSPAYFRQARQKTAGLFAAAALIGAHCAGLPPGWADKLSRFGDDFGVAFQLIDDLKDKEIPKVRRDKASAEISRLNSAAEQRLRGLEGQKADALKRLPSAYLDWASPL